MAALNSRYLNFIISRITENKLAGNPYSLATLYKSDTLYTYAYIHKECVYTHTHIYAYFRDGEIIWVNIYI